MLLGRGTQQHFKVSNVNIQQQKDKSSFDFGLISDTKKQKNMISDMFTLVDRK